MRTISAISVDDPDCAETRAIRLRLGLDGLDPLLCSRHDLARLSVALREELAASRNPFELNGTMLRTIYAVARENGMKVVLDGGAGDLTRTSTNRVAALRTEAILAVFNAFKRLPGRGQFSLLVMQQGDDLVVCLGGPPPHMPPQQGYGVPGHFC